MSAVTDALAGSGSLTALNATTRATGKGALTQNDFLKLMTTQLQTQDPFAPMDTQAMVSQLSQLSNNTGLAEMNASLKAILAKLDALVPATPATTTPAPSAAARIA